MESREESNATDPRRFSTSPSDPLELTASSIDPRESFFDPKTPDKQASVSALKSPPSAFSTTFANSSLYKPSNPGTSAGGQPLNRSVSFRESADGASAPGLLASSTNSSISLPTAAVATSSAPSHHHSVGDHHHQDHNGGAPNTPSASRRSLRSGGGGGGSSAASSSQASSTYVLGTKRLHRRTVPKADVDAAPTHINNLPTAATPQQTPKLRPLTGTSTVGTRSVASSAAATSRRAGGSAVANARRRYPSSGQNGTTEHPKTAEAVALSLLLILFGALVCILCFLYVAAPSTPSNLLASRSLVGEEPRVESVVNPEGGAAHSQQEAVDPSTIRKLRWSVLGIIVAMAALLGFAVKRRLAPKAPTLSASALEQHTKAQREKEGLVSQSPLLDEESDLLVASPSSAVNINSRPIERAPGSSNSQQEKLQCPIHRRLGCPCGWAAAASVSGRNGPASQRCGGPTTASSAPLAPTPLRKVSLCGALRSPNHHDNNGSSPPVNKGSGEGFHKSPDQMPSTAKRDDDDVSASSPQRQLELLA